MNNNNAVLSVFEGMVTFGNTPLFDELTFHIKERDRIALVGRNGAGKSTLMNVIAGSRELDEGKRWVHPEITIGFLPQTTQFTPGQTIKEYVLDGLEDNEHKDEKAYMVDIVCEPLAIDPQDLMDVLSGGQLRRAALAKSLVNAPDILLLDEPTNHLDIASIEWLENYLNNYRGSVICISHDRTFLKNTTNKIFWLDRGNLRTSNKGYGHFDEWYVASLEQEQRELYNLSKKVDQENNWLQKGVTARRKRNERRLKEVYTLREQLKADKSSYNQTINTIKLEPLPPNKASKLVFECKNVYKSFQHEHKDVPILKDFNLRIMRGDRIGIVGKNGSGKTTFLKLLTQQITADSGRVRLAKNLTISYFDQNREQLNPDFTLWKTLCPNGGDRVMVNNKDRHVVAYLKDFLFDPKLARSPVSILSGGQANRLLLAKIMANPGSLLILDEPTNDLDMDTLDMLQEIILNYNGTIILVSHDRDFLDRIATKLLVFEGNGKVEGYAGGYTDYLQQAHPEKLEPTKQTTTTKKQPKAKTNTTTNNKLSYKLQYELDHLPEKIKTLETEITTLNTTLADPNLYTTNQPAFDQASKRLGAAKQELEQAEERWLELETMKEAQQDE